MARPRHVLFALVASSVAVACGSSESPKASNTADTGAKPVDGGGTDAAKAPCSEPSEDPAAQCVETVTGKAVDTGGSPITKKVVSICGRVCFFAQTADDGTFTAKIGTFINVADFAAYVHGRPEYVGVFERLPLGPGRDILMPSTLVLPVLPSSGTRIPIDPATRKVTAATAVTSGEVTLHFAADTEVELDLEDMDLKEKGEELRVVAVAAEDHPVFVKPAPVAVLYGAAPFDAKFSRKVGVTIAATGGLAEGTPVEFFVLGSDFVKDRTAGKLLVVATGKVTGGKIETDPGEGISLLTWLGVRARS